MSLSLPRETVRQFRAYARRVERTQTTVLLDAIEATHERLPALLTAGERTTTGPVFTRTVAAEPAPDRSILPLRIKTLLAQLDNLVTQLDARSRSHRARQHCAPTSTTSRRHPMPDLDLTYPHPDEHLVLHDEQPLVPVDLIWR